MELTDDSFDPTRRQLCPDGACIGLLDDNGRCRECGRTGGTGDAALSAAPFDDQPPFDEQQETMEAAAAEGFDPSRRLCPDGSCVGLLGDDNRCKVCRRSSDEVF